MAFDQCSRPAQLGNLCLRPSGHDGDCSATRLRSYMPPLGWGDAKRHTHQEPPVQRLIDEVGEGMERFGLDSFDMEER